MHAVGNRLNWWTRENKPDLDNYGSWDRRGLIYSSLALSREEKNKWLEFIKDNSRDIIDESLAKYLASFEDKNKRRLT